MLVLLSCEKKDEQAGLEIQPDENRLKIAHINLNTFTTFTDKSESEKTSKKNSTILLGNIYDEIFGRSTAFMIAQYRLSTDNVDFGANAQIISTNMYLDISGQEGDSSQSVHYLFYESKFDIDADSAYSSDFDMSTYVGDLVADTTFSASTFDIMTIPLSNTLGQKILDASSTTLLNNDNFLKEFKGLYFTTDTNQTDHGIIWKYDFNSASSYILLEYAFDDAKGNRDTNTFKLQFNEFSGRFNQFFHNRAPLSDILGKPKQEVYISGMANTKAHISLSPVLSWRDSSKVMIYKAELLVKAKPSSIFSVPNSLLMEIDNSNDDIQFVDDYLPNSANNYGGKYNSETQTYSMVITRHIQNLINNNHNDSLLWIYPYAQITNPNRVILLNGEDNENFTLKITYSKLY